MAGRPRASLALQALALTLLVAACYANSLRVPFLLDDPRPEAPLDYSTRPLVQASFALNRLVSGAAPGSATWSYHVLNAGVHLAAGLLLLGVLRRALPALPLRLDASSRDGLAFVATALWLAHPLQTAAVTYLSQRAESMASSLYLLGFYAFLRAEVGPRVRGWQALTCVALLLGFGTKEIIATLPAALWLFDTCFLARGPIHALRRRPAFYASLALAWLAGAYVYLAPQLWSEGSTAGFRSGSTTALDYARTQPGVLLHYLGLALWPARLCFDYAWPIARATSEWLPQTLVVAGLVLATLVGLLRRSAAGYAGAFFFLVLAPSSSFVPILDPAFEHRMYLALAPVVLLAAGLALRLAAPLPRPAPLLASLATLLVLVLSALTVRRNRDYSSALRLMELTVAAAPENARAFGNLGTALYEEGRDEEAIRAWLEALRLDTRDGFLSLAVTPVAYLGLGRAHERLGEAERALPYLQRAVETAPDWAESRTTLGRALVRAGDPGAAVEHFARALELEPWAVDVRIDLADALATLGRNEEALVVYRDALRLAPELEAAHLGLARVLAPLDLAEEALEHARAAFAREPNGLEECLGFGRLALAARRHAEARTAFTAARTLAPDNVDALAGLAEALCGPEDASPADLAAAREAATRANELTQAARPELLATQARVEAALGEYRGAAALLQKALRLPGVHADRELAAELSAQRERYLRKARQAGGRLDEPRK